MKFLWSSTCIVICTAINVNDMNVANAATVSPNVNVNAANAATVSPNPSNCDANDEAFDRSQPASFTKVALIIENRAKEVIALVSSVNDFFRNMTAEMGTKQLSVEEKNELDRLYAELLHFNSNATVFALTTKVIMKDHKFTEDEITKHTTAILYLRQRVTTLQIDLYAFGSQQKRQRIEDNAQQVVLFFQFAGIAFTILAICSLFKDKILSYCGYVRAGRNQCQGRCTQVPSFLTAAIFIWLSWYFTNIDLERLLEPITMKFQRLEQAQYEDLTPIHEAFDGLKSIFAGATADIHKFESEIVKHCDKIIEHAKMKVR